MANALIDEDKQAGKADIRANLAEARAMFAEAKANNDKSEMAKAQDYFTRILEKLAPGSETFWECWLRIFQAKETLAPGDMNVAEEIKKRLGDLKGIHADKFGGEMYKGEFDSLARKYGM